MRGWRDRNRNLVRTLGWVATMSNLNPDQLRSRAKEILAKAEAMKVPDNRATLARMAASYIQMARQLEEAFSQRAGRWDLPQQQAAQQAQGEARPAAPSDSVAARSNRSSGPI